MFVGSLSLSRGGLDVLQVKQCFRAATQQRVDLSLDGVAQCGAEDLLSLFKLPKARFAEGY